MPIFALTIEEFAKSPLSPGVGGCLLKEHIWGGRDSDWVAFPPDPSWVPLVFPGAQFLGQDQAVCGAIGGQWRSEVGSPQIPGIRVGSDSLEGRLDQNSAVPLAFPSSLGDSGPTGCGDLGEGGDPKIESAFIE